MTDEQLYAELTLEKRDYQVKLKAVQEQLDEVELALLANWAEDEITSMKVNTSAGPYLLYQSTRVFARQEFVELAEVPLEFHMLSAQKCASYLGELLALDDKEGLQRLANLGILPIEKTQIHVKKG